MRRGGWAGSGGETAALADVLYSFDEYELNAKTPELRRNGQPVKADAVALRLLLVLVRSAGQVIGKRELIAQVWDGRAVSDNVITVTMVRLRRTLGQQRGEREFVTNVHGRGYRFALPVHARDAEPAPLLTMATSEPSGPPYVGRSRVLERMRELLQQARSEHGGACLLVGEPGIGKTRAVEMLEREATAAGMLVAWGYCRELGDAPPLSPWLQLARSLIVALRGAATSAQLQPAIAELTGVLPELSEDRDARTHREPEQAELGHGAAVKHRVFSALIQLFTLAAERAGCMLVLDDLHRADPVSLELLRYWIDELPRARVAVIGTLRDHWDGHGAGANAHLAHLLGHRNCERIELTRLREADVQTYVAALLPDPGGALGRAVFAKSEGNPFFMVELARQLCNADAADAALLEVPEAALELVRQRVAVLDGATRGVLSCAAVVGRSFELAVLQAVTEDEPRALIASLDHAVSSAVIGTSPSSRTQFVFAHDLLRAALYEALPAAARRNLHLRVGLALEQRLLAGEPIASAELAYHFYAALPETDLRKTAQHCMDAAWAAADVYANADVRRHLRHAVEALDAMPQASPRLRMRLLLRCAQFARIDAPVEFAAMIAEITRFASQVGSGRVLAYAAMLSDADAGFPAILPAHGVLEAALDLLGEEDYDLRAAMFGRLARHAPHAYDTEQSNELLRRGFVLEERGPLSVMTRYNLLASQLYLEGGPAHGERSSAYLHEIDRLCSETASMTIPPPLLDLHRAIVALQRGEMSAMQAALERCVVRSQRIHHRELTFFAERARLMARVNVGELARVRGELDALHRRAAAEGMLGVALICAYDRQVVLGERDRWPEGIPAFDAEDAPNVWSLRLRTLLAAGQIEQARTGLRRVPPDQLAKLPCDRDYLGTLAALARCALALGAVEYFDPLYRLLAPYPKLFAVHVSMYCEGPVALLLGLLAQAGGRTQEANSQLEASVALAQRAGLLPAADEALRALSRRRV